MVTLSIKASTEHRLKHRLIPLSVVPHACGHDAAWDEASKDDMKKFYLFFHEQDVWPLLEAPSMYFGFGALEEKPRKMKSLHDLLVSVAITIF